MKELENLTKNDLKALGVFHGTFNRRTDGSNMIFSEALLTVEQGAAYHNALTKLKKLWLENKNKKKAS